MVTSCLIDPGLILYILLGAIVGIVYSLRRIFRLEKLILAIDEKMENRLAKKQMKAKRKKSRRWNFFYFFIFYKQTF